METGSSFETWWRNIGSGIAPTAQEDHAEHMARLARIVWDAGQHAARQGEEESPAPAQAAPIQTLRLLPDDPRAHAVAPKAKRRTYEAYSMLIDDRLFKGIESASHWSDLLAQEMKARFPGLCIADQVGDAQDQVRAGTVRGLYPDVSDEIERHGELVAELFRQGTRLSANPLATARHCFMAGQPTVTGPAQLPAERVVYASLEEILEGCRGRGELIPFSCSKTAGFWLFKGLVEGQDLFLIRRKRLDGGGFWLYPVDEIPVRVLSDLAIGRPSDVFLLETVEDRLERNAMRALERFRARVEYICDDEGAGVEAVDRVRLLRVPSRTECIWELEANGLSVAQPTTFEDLDLPSENKPSGKISK